MPINMHKHSNNENIYCKTSRFFSIKNGEYLLINNLMFLMDQRYYISISIIRNGYI